MSNPARRWAGIAVVWLVACAVVAGSQRARYAAQLDDYARQQTPVFKSGTELVLIDVSVLDRQRQPIRGLAVTDFVVKEDGRPVELAALHEIDLSDPPPPPVAWMRDVAPDVTTNTIGESRVIVIVVDDALIPLDPLATRTTKQVLSEIIGKLGPSDYTAIVYSSDGRKAQDFTHDRSALLTAAQRFIGGHASYTFGREGRDASGTAPVDPDSHYYLSSIGTLQSIVDILKAVPERRKALIWISPGVPVDATEAAGTMAVPITAGSSGGFMSGNAIAQRMSGDMRDLMARAQQANVSIYPIDPMGLIGLEEHIVGRLIAVTKASAELARPFAHTKATASLDFLLTAAQNTGGHALVNTNEFGPGIDAIFRENSSYYLLGIRPLNVKGNGGFRRIEVSVKRPGAEVHARSGYYDAKPDDPKRTANMSPETATLAKALGGVLPQSGLPLGVTVAPVAVSGQRLAAVAIVLGIEQPIVGAPIAEKRTQTTELQISAFTPDGEPRGNRRSTAKVTLRAGAAGEAIYQVFGRIDLAPGRYALRIAAHNAASSKTGTLTANVLVPDFATEPLSTSGVIVSRTPARAAAPTDLLTSLFPLVPSAEREFETTDNVDVFLRLYQSGTKSVGPVVATIRLADDRGGVEVRSSRVIAADAFTLTTKSVDKETVPPSAVRPQSVALPAAKPDQFASAQLREAPIRDKLPIATLKPGNYLWTIEATLGAITVRRDVRFSVR